MSKIGKGIAGTLGLGLSSAAVYGVHRANQDADILNGTNMPGYFTDLGNAVNSMGQSAGEFVQATGPGFTENLVTYGIPGVVGLLSVGLLYKAIKD